MTRWDVCTLIAFLLWVAFTVVGFGILIPGWLR